MNPLKIFKLFIIVHKALPIQKKNHAKTAQQQQQQYIIITIILIMMIRIKTKLK